MMQRSVMVPSGIVLTLQFKPAKNPMKYPGFIRSMISISYCALMPLGWLAGAGAATAATITWDAPQPIAGASDVSTEGAYFGTWAPYNGNANQYPVNGVTFQGYDDLGISNSGFVGGGPYFGDHSTPDANYNALLIYGTYANGTTATVTINGNGAKPLVPGRQYLVQFWVSDARNLGQFRSESVSGSAAVSFPADGSGMGSFVIGRFIADAANQQLDLNANASAQINLLQVRDITPVSVTAAYFDAASASIWDAESTAAWSLTSGGPYSQTWKASGAGTAVFEGTAGPVSLDGVITPSTITFNSSGYSLGGTGSLAMVGASTIITGTGTATVDALVTGSNGLIKQGPGTLVLTANNSLSGNFGINGGVLELNRTVETDYLGATTFTGTGTLRKSGTGQIEWGSATTTFALASGALIDIQAGTFKGGSYGNDVWTDNYADLNVASGAVFLGTEANVRVDVLSGQGTIRSGYPGAGYSRFSFGVDGGSGTFDGVLTDENAPGNFTKEGTGTQTLTGFSTYSGTTTVNAGTLVFSQACLPNNGAVVVATGAKLGLNFTGLDGVGSLVLGGEAKPPGTYNATTDPDYLVGPGSLVIREPLTWTGSASQVWDAVTTNWEHLGSPDSWLSEVPDEAIFNGQGLGTITLAGPTAAAKLTIDTAGYTIAGSTLTLGGRSPEIVANADIAIASGLAGTTGLIKTGPGTLTLTGNNTYTGLTDVGSGAIMLTDTATLATTGSLWLGGSASFTLSGTAAATFVDLNLGKATASPATFNQNGGTLTVTGVSSENCAVRIGHWPSETSTYTLANGTLQITAEGGLLAMGTDGTGIFTQTGGTLVAPGIVVNQRNGTGEGILNLNGGTTTLGSAGIATHGAPYTVNLGGGTLAASAAWTSALAMNLSGTSILDTAGGDISLTGALVGTGGLTKRSNGTLVLSGRNTYTGDTAVTAGTLELAEGAQLTFAVTNTGATIVTGQGTAVFKGEFAIDLSAVAVKTGMIWTLVNASNKQFADSFSVTGFTADPDGIHWTKPAGLTSYSFSEQTGELTLDYPPYAMWADATLTGIDPLADASPAADPDHDGLNNLAEFAFDGNPLSAANLGKMIGKTASVGGQTVFTLTLPVRNDTYFTTPGSPANRELVSDENDNMIYRIQGSDADLTDWSLEVTEITGPDAVAIQAGLPGLSNLDGDDTPDWTYRTFATPGPVSSDATDFLRAKVQGNFNP